MAGQNDESENGDDDWFERALQDDESAEDGDGERSTERLEEDDVPEESFDGAEGGEFAGGTAGDDEAGSAFAEAFDESTPDDAVDFDVEGSGGESFGFDGEDSSGESFGFDLGGDSADETFDDEDFESDIPRIDLGIEGLDEMIQGGVPERTLLVSIGGAGTGKTTFGLQFLNKALVDGERGVYITLEESRQRVIQSAEEKGWDFEQFEEEGRLAIIDLDPVEMANSLTSIRNELPRLVEAFGASRLVLDSVSLLEMMYDDQATRRTEIYDFARALKEAGVTTMLTSEADADNPFASRYGIIEYLTDAVFVLRHVRPDDFRETRLAIEIQKIRDANHSRETKPYEITDTGISVYREANIF